VGKSSKARLLLVAITIAALAPFLTKAFHMDDPLFLWMAQQIAKHPLDPYGFSVNWSTFPEPMSKVMQNPPLCSYYIAAVASLTGWSELALHLAFLIWPILSILATFAVARRFCGEPLIAALLTLFTPVFLVSATNIMCDLMLLALWLWSIECWIAGLDDQRWRLLALSAVLATAAALTKYFGISIVPLLAAYTLARDRGFSRNLAWLLVPVTSVIVFELWTKTHYGTGLVGGAVYLSRTIAKLGPPWFGQLLTGLAFTGGCAFSALFCLPRRKWRSWLITIISTVALLTLFYFLVPLRAVYALGQNSRLVWIEGGLFATIGAAILALGIADLIQHRDAPSALLLLWLVGTFMFATFFNWSITGRTILPMAPVAAILLMRRFETIVSTQNIRLHCARVFIAATVSLIVTAADYRQAQTAGEASREFQRRFQAGASTVWFESHWGFQYYMQLWGATPLTVFDSEVTSGDVIVFPSNNTSIIPLPMDRISPPETVKFATLPFISTHGRGTGAAFYSSVRGPLPWAIDHVPPELYYVAKFR
jgi:Dolichyl-phosphate-mannose-protein mannosyltransferase